MLLYNVWYFFYFGGMVCIWPYLNILYRSNGLNDAQIGILAAVKPWTSAPASFIWSGLADRFSAHRIIMISTFVTSTLTRTSVSFCHTFVAFFILSLAGEFLAAPVGVMADAAVVAACTRDTDYGKSRLWGAVAWGSLSAVSGAMVSHFGMWSGFLAYMLLSVPCVICAWRMEFNLGSLRNKQQPKQQDNEQQQCRSNDTPLQSHSIATSKPTHLLSTASEGALSQQQQCQQQPQHWQQPRSMQEQQTGLDSSKELQTQEDRQQSAVDADVEGGDADACALLLDCSSSTVQPASQLHQQQHVQLVFQSVHHKPQQDGALSSVVHAGSDICLQEDQVQAGGQGQGQQAGYQFWQGLRQLLTTPAVLIFMWQATVMGFGIGVIGEFLFLFLQDLGGSETLMGLTLTVTCIAEVPMFHYQPQILKIIPVPNMLHFVMWTYTLRMGLYALLPYMGSAWAVLPIELLHGITFGCGWSAGTITSKRVAPAGLEATMQGIFQGLYFGVGQGLGALVGGLLKQRYGGQIMFGMCALIVLAGWIACVAAEHLLALAASAEGKAAVQPSCVSAKSNPPGQARSTNWLLNLKDVASRALGTEPAANSIHSNGVRLPEASRPWKYKYAGLASKDSGPDLQLQLARPHGGQQCASGTCTPGGCEGNQLTS